MPGLSSLSKEEQKTQNKDILEEGKLFFTKINEQIKQARYAENRFAAQYNDLDMHHISILFLKEQAILQHTGARSHLMDIQLSHYQ